MSIKGIHHVSSITASAQKNYHFYNKVLGMRLVKKTVNQDDTSMYHLFYADEQGNPGTDFTFFEIPRAGHTYEGNNSITATSLRVKDDAALRYWEHRLEENEIPHEGIADQNGRSVIYFRDPEGQRLVLVSDQTNEGVPAGKPWKESPVPTDKAITGLGPVKFTVPSAAPTANVLTRILGFRETGNYPSTTEGQPDIRVFEVGEGGTGAEIHLEERKDLSRERPGRGSTHHVALRVEDIDELKKWVEKISKERFSNSGLVDRFYFQSLYFREPNGILIELATDGPGFTTDEDIDHLGESIALPPFLEDRRTEIEAKLKPLDTTN